MIIQWDVDGVLADFRRGWKELVVKRYGIDTPLNESTWDGLYTPIGQERTNNTWEHIRQSKTFWFDLEPLITLEEMQLIRNLNQKHTMYFVTNRVGSTAKRQTERWLSTYVGVDLETPTVLISNRKADAANALNADYVIDDKPGNVLAVYYNSPSTRKVYLRDHVFNRFDFAMAGRGLRRVETVMEFLNDIEQGH